MGLFRAAIIPVLAVAIIGVSALQLRAHVLANSASEDASRFRQDIRTIVTTSSAAGQRDSRNGSPSPSTVLPKGHDDGPRSLELEGQETLQLAARAGEVVFAEPRAMLSHAALLRTVSEAAVSNQVPTYCQSLAVLGRALENEPRNARALMQWANLRQILGSIDCGLPLTKGDYKKAISAALELDPTDPDAQYAAGLIMRWGGADDESAELFNRVLRYHPRLNPLQERQILEGVRDADALQKVVPGRFPQILRASRYFAQSPVVDALNPANAIEFEKALAALQRQAVELSKEEYSRGEIPYTMHFDRLTQLLDVAANVKLRQDLDSQLSFLLTRRGEGAVANYLASRSGWNELEIVPTVLSGDTRPLRTPLVGWGNTGSFFVDEFYRTVGFYLAEEQGIHSIELAFSERPSSAFHSTLRLYASSDNQNWTEVAPSRDGGVFSVGAKHLSVLRVPARGDRYWKVHFANAARDKKLLGNLGSVLRVYGASARGPGEVADDG